MPDTRTYNVISNDNCLFESMTKEQILAAITQAVETHEIGDVDTGFVTTIKERNREKALKFWIGTTAEYNAIETKDNDCFYILTDDTELEDIESELDDFRQSVSAMGDSISDINDTLTNQAGQISDLESWSSVFEADFKRQRAKKGAILLNQSVDYDDLALPLPLYYVEPDPETGEVICAYDFQMVKVLVSGVGEILCDVYKADSDNCYIRGVGCGASTTNGVTTGNVNLKIDISDNTLTQNHSTLTVITAGGSVSLAGATITKIIGVM